MSKKQDTITVSTIRRMRLPFAGCKTKEKLLKSQMMLVFTGDTTEKAFDRIPWYSKVTVLKVFNFGGETKGAQ